MLAPGSFLLPAVLLCAGGYSDYVIIHLLCKAGCVIVGGGVGLGEYGKCIMQFGFGFGIEYFFSFTVTCYHNPFVIFVLSFLRHPRMPSIISQLIALACIPT